MILPVPNCANAMRRLIFCNLLELYYVTALLCHAFSSDHVCRQGLQNKLPAIHNGVYKHRVNEMDKDRETLLPYRHIA